jgi:hypothetical protein
MQIRESAPTVGYHSANGAVTHNEDQIDEATIGALANLKTATAADRGVVAVKALLNQERSAKHGQHIFNPSSTN